MFRFFTSFACLLLRNIPGSFVRNLARLVEIEISHKTPADALRLLFSLDAALYKLQSHFSVLYGDGLHTKHRHTRYHYFFVDRLQPHSRVLDIGCGNGSLAFDMAEKSGAMVTAIDLEQANITMANSHHAHPRVEYICGDVLTDLPIQTYDVIVLSNVLEHLPHRPEFLRNIREKLAPARYLIRVPLFERDWRVPLKKELGVEWRLDAGHYTEYTKTSFLEEMTASGLRITHMETCWGEIWCELHPAD